MLLAAASLFWSGVAGAQLCVGDCDGDKHVTANEIVSVVRAECPAGDVSDLAIAIENVFAGCPVLSADWEVAYDASQLGWILSGWGPGDGSLWVVGGTEDNGRMLRYQHGRWSEVDLGFSVPLLNWVHGTSASDVFAGGVNGTMLHFDGESWVQQSTPVSDPVWGIWAVAPDDVWAVGGEPIFGVEPFVLHYDGEAWSHVAIPPLQRPGVAAFFKVWGSGPDDIWIVGQNGVLMHWDGAVFTETGAGISQDLIGIWGNGPDDIMVVGGRGTAELAHFDGVSWSHAPPSRLPGLSGVWTRRPDVAHAVGVNGTVLRVDPRTLQVLDEEAAPTTLELHAVFGDNTGQVLAFGANFDLPERGVVLIRGLSDED